jgi:hypothetical protein
MVLIRSIGFLFPTPYCLFPVFRKSPFLPGLAYPWRCLCFAFSQMTRTTPLRVITLHFTQIFFTDARTFIFYCPSPRSTCHAGIKSLVVGQFEIFTF